MTVSSTPSVKTYTGNGVTTTFSTVFQFIDEGDVKVYLDGILKAITTHYTVTGGDGSIGSVVFVTPPASDVAIVLQRLVDYVQETDYADFGGNPAATTETQFDLVVMQCQQLLDATGRALSVAVGIDFAAEIAVSGNEGKYLRINDAGDAFDFTSTVDTGTVSVSEFAATVVDDTSAASMRQTLLFPAQSASKRGSILVQNTSDDGYEQITSQGSIGDVLVSAGADALPVWTTLSTSLILLQTLSASSSPTIDFTTGISSTYTTYIVQMTNVVLDTDNVDMFCRVSIAASFKSGGSDYSWTMHGYKGGIDLFLNDASDSEINLSALAAAGGIGNVTNEGFNGRIILPGPSNTALFKNIRIQSEYTASDGVPAFIDGTGRYISGVQAIDGLQFLSSSGNITSGTFKLYGVL